MSRVLVVTGFGPFAGVEKNPTQDIVEYLTQEWNSIQLSDGTNVPIHYFIVEVSVDGCESVLADISKQFPDSEITFVHLGVDARASHIKLEEYAYNNMSFRVPDQRNFQPQGKPIQPALAFDLPLQTCWNIPALIRNVQQHQFDPSTHDVTKHEIDASTDPGRFLCNYIYFRSMLFRPCCRSRSIFVHVPPFEFIPKMQQVNIIKQLACDMITSCSQFDRNVSTVSEGDESAPTDT